MKPAQELICIIKETKQKQRITYDDIMRELTKNGSPAVSLTTLRRVFASGSEDRASSFNYESTILPVYNAVMDLSTKDESPFAKENAFFIEQLKWKDAVIEEKNETIKRLISRLDRKDDIIMQLIVDLRQKDNIISHLMGNNE